MVLRYGPITAGEGATYSWTSDQDPNGNQQMIKVVEMDTILTKLNFEDQDPADGYWYFAKAGEGRTSVTWGLKGDLPFFGRIFGLFADGQIGNDFEAGLSNLKYLVESSKSEFIERPVQTVEKDSIIYLSISENVDMNNNIRNYSSPILRRPSGNSPSSQSIERISRKIGAKPLPRRGWKFQPEPTP